MATTEASPLAGKTVRLAADMGHPDLDGAEYRVEDWWLKVAGKSWRDCNGNPACLSYAIRTGLNPTRSIPSDDRVLYGKVGAFGHLVHESEVVEVIG